MLHRNEADVASSFITMTLERSFVADFTVALSEEFTDFTTRRTSSNNLDFLAYVNLFDTDTWICVITFVSTSAFLMVVMAKTKNNSFHDVNDPEQFGLMQSFSVVGANLLQRDYQLLRKSESSKMILFLSAFISYVCFTFYTALLTSHMTFPVPSAPIREFLDAKTLGYRVIASAATSHHGYLVNAPEGSSLHALYNGPLDGSFTTSDPEEIIEHLIDSDKTVYFGNPARLELSPEVYSLKVQDRLVGQIAFALRKNSELTEMFNYHLTNMDERGILENLRIRYTLPEDAYPEKEAARDSVHTLSFGNVLFPFIAVATGAGMAFMVLLVEHYRKLRVKDRGNTCFNHSIFIRTTKPL